MAQTQVFRGVQSRIERDDSTTRFIYRGTTVVEWFPLQERVVLRDGGWKSLTTKLRMNQASNQFSLGYTVYQKARRWFVRTNAGTYRYKDGMQVSTVSGGVSFYPHIAPAV